MYGKKILVTALSSTLLLGAAAGASYAASDDASHPMPGHEGHRHMGPHHMGMHKWRHGPMMRPEVLYIRMVQQFDSNHDMKVSRDELKAGVDAMFDAADTNKDGELTPKEVRDYRMQKIKAWREERAQQMDQNKKSGDKAAMTQTGDDMGEPGHEGPGKHGHRGPGMREARMQSLMMFARLDKDGNGRISKKEAEDGANRLFDRLDRNKDGVISIDDMPKGPF